MTNYNIIASTEAEKCRIIDLIRTVGARLTGVSGYGTGYYIQLDATEMQALSINTELAKGGATA